MLHAIRLKDGKKIDEQDIDELELKKIKKYIDEEESSKEIKTEKYEMVQSVPPRFRSDAYECIEYSNDWKTLRKSWEYFLDDILNEMSEKEKKEWGFMEVCITIKAEE